MITLTRSKDFDRVFRRGNSVSSSELVLYALKRSRYPKLSEVRAAFCVSKKFGGAVERNRVRRRLREVYRLNQEKLENQWDVILLARRGAAEAKFVQLEKKFLSLCRKAGVLKKTDAPAADNQQI